MNRSGFSSAYNPVRPPPSLPRRQNAFRPDEPRHSVSFQDPGERHPVRGTVQANLICGLSTGGLSKPLFKPSASSNDQQMVCIVAEMQFGRGDPWYRVRLEGSDEVTSFPSREVQEAPLLCQRCEVCLTFVGVFLFFCNRCPII